MSCTHYTTRQVWVERENDWTGETYGEWEEQSTCHLEDIDLHRMKCTLCGEIKYYSGRARDFYEKGIRTPGIDGLE